MDRADIIEWWVGLEWHIRARLFDAYKARNFTPASVPSQLTGREIELIYKGVLNAPADPAGEAKEDPGTE